jgi:hypothetical protein
MSAPTLSAGDVVDHAITAMRGIRLEPAAYVHQLDRDNLSELLSERMGRRIVHRSSLREHWYIDVDSGSAVRMLLETTERGTSASVAERVADGDAPQFFERLISCAMRPIR